MAEQAVAVLSSAADVVEVGAQDVDDETSLSFLWTPPTQDR
jgi:hypothetical protein